jgi:hypothetical protein
MRYVLIPTKDTALTVEEWSAGVTRTSSRMGNVTRSRDPSSAPWKRASCWSHLLLASLASP